MKKNYKHYVKNIEFNVMFSLILYNFFKNRYFMLKFQLSNHPIDINDIKIGFLEIFYLRYYLKLSF